MFDNNRKKDRATAKQKVRDRINAGFDRSKYKYIPEEKPLNYCDDNITQTVGIYVRVSTDDVRQTTSYELQKKYYEDFVQKHPNWKLYKIYADEGISGTSTTKREAFNEMISDAKAHKIDLTLTIPSWSSSIERTKSKADLSIVSDKARANLISALYNLQNCVDGMLKAIKEDK